MEDFLTDEEDKPFKRPHPLKYAVIFGGAWLIASFAIYWSPWMSLSFAAGAITALMANQ